MGTTLTALQGNAGVAVDYVVAIEGWPTLLCSGSPTAALTAWTGTDWEEAVGGLSVTGQIKQSIDPWRPFGEASTITLSVVPCPGQTAGTDRFGEDVWKRSGGTATDVTTSVDCNDTSLVTLSTAAFGATGKVYVGNEAAKYTSKTGTTFTISERGWWSPFTTESGGRFAHPHRLVDANSANVRLPPEATTIPRGMVGRWVGVWMHRRLGSTLDVKAQAHLAWAGRIRDVEESEAGATVLTCESALASINDTMILRDQYRARIKPGIYLAAGVTFDATTMRDLGGSTASSWGVLDALTVVSSGASGANELDAGTYSVEDIAAKLNEWFASELTATRSLFTLAYTAYVFRSDGARPRLYLSDDTAGSADRKVSLYISSPSVAQAMGWPTDTIEIRTTNTTGTTHGDRAPMRSILFQIVGANHRERINVDDVRGTYISQATTLPLPLRGDGWQAVFQVGNIGRFKVYQVSASQYDYEAIPGSYGGTIDAIPAGQTVEEEGDIEVSQVLVMEESFAEVMRQVISSTGTGSFNNTYDKASEAVGCAIPHQLIDSLIDTDLAAVDFAEATITVVVDKPTRLTEVFAADFIMRKSFLVWRNEQIRLASWQTPNGDYAAVALTEANKHAPIDHRDKQRASVFESDAWMRNVVKLKYGRRPDGTYAYETTYEDGPSVRRHGAKPVTIELRNLSAGQGATVMDQLAASFADWLPVLSRPVARVRRTMSRQLFETATAGAQATITDEHVRDWTTGLRGITTEPGLVVSEWHDWGGATHGEDGAPSVRGPMGEVELLVYPTNVAVYVPCAQVDDTATTSGYVESGGTYTLTCYAHKHSESGEVADATRFVAGDKIRIVQIDPDDPAAPDTWDRTVASQTGNTIVITVALSSPAWDTAKRYRVIYDTYGDAQASQLTKCFQADDADGLIADTAQAYEYSVFTGGQSGANAATAAAATDLPSRHATLAYGDGVGLDVGYELDIANLCNNLIGYKTAPQCPRVYSEGRGWTAGGTWLMVGVEMVFVGPGVLTWSGKTRKLYVGPRMKVSSGTGSVRVSLCRGLPLGTSLYDNTIPAPYVQTTFTTTSTSYVNKTAVALDIAHLPLTLGWGYLVVEINANTSYAGMHTQYVGPLVTPS